MPGPSVLPGRAFHRIDRVSRAVLHYRAADLVLTPLTGQPYTFSRAGPATAVPLAGPVIRAPDGQPRFELRDWNADGVPEQPVLLLGGPRTNLIENGDYESDANGSAATGGSVARSTAQARHGSASLQVTTIEGANSGVIIRNRDNTRFAVTAARHYSCAAWIYAPTASVGKTIRLGVEWWDAATGGAQVSGSPSNAGVVTLVAGWQYLIFNDVVALTGATHALMRAYTDVAGQGAFSFWVDLAQFELGAFISSSIPTNTAAASSVGEVYEITGFSLDMNRDWSMLLRFQAEHMKIASWPDTEPQMDPFLCLLSPDGAETDNGGSIALHRQNSLSQYEWEYMLNRNTVSRTLTPGAGPASLVARHHANDHHLSLSLDGGAFADGTAPTTVTIAPQIMLRLGRNSITSPFMALAEAKIVYGLHTRDQLLGIL